MEEILNEIIRKLSEAKIENPRLEARLMLAEVLHRKSSDILSDTVLSQADVKKVQTMLAQRLQHKPLDKILGHREFYKFDFMINEDVLSPRPDTEILVENALEILQTKSDCRILDLGCGSGCIIETLLKEISSASGVAVDISDKALAIAKKNADNLAIDKRLQFIKADWFANDFSSLFNNKFDMIVSNPPYIPSDDIETLEKEVKNFDPLLALNGGKSGYDSYEAIAKIAPCLLKEEGYILLEAGYGQAQNIADIFTARGLILNKIVDDLSGIARCVILQKAVAENKKS